MFGSIGKVKDTNLGNVNYANGWKLKDRVVGRRFHEL